MEQHSVQVDLSQAKQGENEYTCTLCGKGIALVWDGILQGDTFTPTSWALTHDEQWDNPIGEVRVIYV